ncbi:hypothetical protein CLU79DRAFT_770962 [Phycomyces nitens]|nr:hypothetical protein CLU79DRAFT_770962 [Phycomyces nitens]
MMGIQHRFDGSLLFPVNILKMLNILGIILVFAAAIGIFGAFYPNRQTLHILYTTIVMIAFIYQLATAAIVYDQAVHIEGWLSQVWADSSRDYRLYAQHKFVCCGFAHVFDHPVVTDSCGLSSTTNSSPPCYGPAIYFIRKQLSVVYILLFAALSIELLALSNAVTLMCNRHIDSDDEELDPAPSKRPRLFGPKQSIRPNHASESDIALGYIPKSTQRQSNPEWKYARGGSSPTLADSAISESSFKEPSTPNTMHKPDETIHSRQY